MNRKAMSKKTLTALQGAIKKWESIARGEGLDQGIENCPLCQLYFDDICRGCPINNKTGTSCDGTPYEAWCDIAGIDNTADTPERKKAALAEVRFLKSLLPKG
jgi:hypothetical protein